MEKMGFQVSAECCESFVRTGVRGETIPNIAGAAERKPRAPNEMLQRVTDRRLAEADRRVLHGVCHWTRLARYGGLPV